MRRTRAIGLGRGAVLAAIGSALAMTVASTPDLRVVAGTRSDAIAPLLPVRVTRAFDPPATPYGSGHRGADLAGWVGQPVRSALGGTVVFAGVVAGQPVVSIESPDGSRLTYEPVAADVGRGTTVARGATLGRLLPGHPGCPAQACLHWGLITAAGYADPLLLLRDRRVRLLPWHGEPDEAP